MGNKKEEKCHNLTEEDIKKGLERSDTIIKKLKKLEDRTDRALRVNRENLRKEINY